MDEVKLIEAVKIRTLIYDKNHEDHFHRAAVARAWEEIGDEIGYDAVTCKKRWIAIKDYFVKRYKERVNPKYGPSMCKKRKWHLYDHLAFLIPWYHRHRSQPDGHYVYEEPINLPINKFETDEAETQSEIAFSENESCGSPKLRDEIVKATNKQHSGLEVETVRIHEPDTVIDDNELFLRSLLPSIRSLGMLKAFEFRYEVHGLLLKYLKQNDTKACQTNEETNSSH